MENNEIMMNEVNETIEEQIPVVVTSCEDSNNNGTVLLVAGAVAAGYGLCKLAGWARDKFEDRVYDAISKKRAKAVKDEPVIVDVEPEEILDEE